MSPRCTSGDQYRSRESHLGVRFFDSCAAINTGAYSESAVGSLVDELKSLVVANFISFQCVFKVRECNRAAHRLAMLGG